MQSTINSSATSVVTLILSVFVERFDHHRDTNGSMILETIHTKDMQTTTFSICLSLDQHLLPGRAHSLELIEP
jgi:hypothetical protein